MWKCAEHLVYDFAYQDPKLSTLSPHVVSQYAAMAEGNRAGLDRDRRACSVLNKDDDGTNESDAESDHRGPELSVAGGSGAPRDLRAVHRDPRMPARLRAAELAGAPSTS